MKKDTMLNKTIRHGILIIVTLIMIYPLLLMLSSSFKFDSDIFSTSSLWPEKWTFEHYLSGFGKNASINFSKMFLYSFLISVVVVIGTIISSSLTAFAFARLNFKPKSFFVALMLSTMMLPAQVVIIPQYIVFQKLSLVNTFVPLMLPSFFATIPFFVYLMMQFIRGIPKDLDEAA